MLSPREADAILHMIGTPRVKMATCMTTLSNLVDNPPYALEAIGGMIMVDDMISKSDFVALAVMSGRTLFKFNYEVFSKGLTSRT